MHIFLPHNPSKDRSIGGKKGARRDGRADRHGSVSYMVCFLNLGEQMRGEMAVEALDQRCTVTYMISWSSAQLNSQQKALTRSRPPV